MLQRMVRAAVVVAGLGVAVVTLPARQGATLEPSLFAALRWRNVGPHRASRTRAEAGHASHHYFDMAAVNSPSTGAHQYPNIFSAYWLIRIRPLVVGAVFRLNFAS